MSCHVFEHLFLQSQDFLQTLTLEMGTIQSFTLILAVEDGKALLVLAIKMYMQTSCVREIMLQDFCVEQV